MPDRSKEIILHANATSISQKHRVQIAPIVRKRKSPEMPGVDRQQSSAIDVLLGASPSAEVGSATTEQVFMTAKAMFATCKVLIELLVNLVYRSANMKSLLM